jgi:hypothetical protein
MQKKPAIKLLGVISLLMVTGIIHAQTIGTGIDAAAGEVKTVFTNVSNLVLMIGGVVGLVGGIRVFVRWQNGERDIQKEVVGWMGACVFLLLAGTALKTMFGM